MPGWHEALKELIDNDRVAMVGIVQEQHPDRANLFMQWKQMDWPLMVDSLNELGVAVVPITLLIDEHGIIRTMNPRTRDPKATVEAFLAESFEDDAAGRSIPTKAGDLSALAAAARDGGADDQRAFAIAAVNWGVSASLDRAISALERATEAEADHGLTHFQLGAAYRKRYDSPQRKPGDFQAAADHWLAALDINPNQYIWRRRIQQYGPRLDKPYPFYDWVAQARADITARGEEPAALVAEPSGTELAARARFSVQQSTRENPDPAGRIERVKSGAMLSEAIIVPAKAKPGNAVRVHVTFRPNPRGDLHWNNEAEGVFLWIGDQQSCQVDRSFVQLDVDASKAVSKEMRTCEFEVRVPEDATAQTLRLPMYALYYVCSGADGACVYRRHDLTVTIPVRTDAK